MIWVSSCFYNPNKQIALNLSGSDAATPTYAIIPGDYITPNPISMADSPIWIYSPTKPGELGYKPTGTRIVSPFGIKYIYH